MMDDATRDKGVHSYATTDYEYCIVCQSDKQERLITEPKESSYSKILDIIEKRCGYKETEYVAISVRLGNQSAEELKSKSATWHNTCYKLLTNVDHINRARVRHESLSRPLMVDVKEPATPSDPPTKKLKLTRSQTSPYNPEKCFFCDMDGTRYNPLHKVGTTSAGANLEKAMKLSDDEKLKVKHCTALNPSDAHAINIRYHNRCWTVHVTNVLRPVSMKVEHTYNDADASAEIEFLALVESLLIKGDILSIPSLQMTYENIRADNNIGDVSVRKPRVKALILNEFPGVQVNTPLRKNQPQEISMKRQAADIDATLTPNIKTLFEAADTLRKAVLKSEKWQFKGSLMDFNEKHLPDMLYSFFRWLVAGPTKSMATESKSKQIDKDITSLCQMAISLIKSDRQISRKQATTFRSSTVVPRQVAIGLSIHQASRSKKAIDQLYAFGVSIPYGRVLRLETQLAESILHIVQRNGGIFVPLDFVKDRRVYFAIDNVDFLEDTPDGKGTSHVTALAMYQRVSPDDKQQVLVLIEGTQKKTLQEEDLPEIVTTLHPCDMPKSPTPTYPSYPAYIQSVEETFTSACKRDTPWLLGRIVHLSHGPSHEPSHEPQLSTLENARDTPYECVDEMFVEESPSFGQQFSSEQMSSPATATVPFRGVQTWSAYLSQICKPLPLTRVAVAPLIPAPAHEWSTLLTALLQAQAITSHVVGQGKTVISLDIALYIPAKQLQMHRGDLNSVILRPGELHIVMASLRTIGAYIENSGIDMCLVEADIYSATTVRQIIEGKHVSRGVHAHLTILEVLYHLYFTAFAHEHPEEAQLLQDKAKELNYACTQSCSDAGRIKAVHAEFADMLESLGIEEKMKVFEENGSRRPMFQAMLQYMRMVVELCLFVRSVRTGDWNLHLSSLDALTKYFFAHDKRNYARAIPLYLADMKRLSETAPDILNEFLSGNWVVNRSTVPFCAIGGDHALEHINRSMKVSGGICGISLNPSARTRFFLIAPEMARLARETRLLADITNPQHVRHHENNSPTLHRLNAQTSKVLKVFQEITNPFQDDSPNIVNIITKKVMPENIQVHVLQRDVLGQQKYQEFVTTRILNSDINVWDKLPNLNMKMWKDVGKKVKMKVKDTIVELKETNSLLIRLLVVAKSRPQINLKQCIGVYEFSVVPRSLFATDGTMHHCSKKSALMDILEDAAKKYDPPPNVAHCGTHTEHRNVVVVDGMAQLQSFTKEKCIKTCRQLAEAFVHRMERYYGCYDELHVIFDRYDVPMSLKYATRERRQASGEQPVAYKIDDNTPVGHLSMSKLIAHSDTKHALTVYLSSKLIEQSKSNNRQTVVAFSTQVLATKFSVDHLASTQEEADTKLLLHACDAAQRGATHIDIVSPDTDVFVLAVHRYPQLCPSTSFLTGSGNTRRSIPVGRVYNAIGALKSKALPAFHAFSGADNTGSFFGKGKLSCWKIFVESNDNTVNAFAALASTSSLEDIVTDLLEAYVCRLFLTGTKMTSLADLRWFMFNRKQSQAENLPPTRAALVQAILRAQHQTIVWTQDQVPHPCQKPPDQFGWEKLGDTFQPIMSTIPPAPDAVLELVQCSCKKTRCSTARCKCQANNMPCCELCACSEDENSCQNPHRDAEIEDDSDGETSH